MLKWRLRGSSSRSPKEAPKTKYHLPRAAEVRPCEWPCDTFLRDAGLLDDFYYLVDNAGLIPFLEDKCEQYLLLTNTFVQSFHFHSRRETPMVSFNLYDIPREMTLEDFSQVCLIPNEGSPIEPHPRDVAEFISEVTVGESRGVSEARVASLHFSILRYYSLFTGRCLTGRWESGTLSSPDLTILCHALYADRTFSLGAMVVRRLHTNHSKGVIYGGIYASRLAKHFEIPIRHNEAEERRLPTMYLDYDSMVGHNFINSRDVRFRYNLVFSQGTREIITLPAPTLFDLHRGRYTIMPEDIYAYWGLTQPQAPESAPEPEPYQEPVYQWELQEPVY